jgi:ABC-type phosphate transport system substrate-binding protein
MKRRPFAGWHALVCACLIVLWAGRAEAGFVVVRNAKNSTAKLSKDGVKGVFSGKTKTWPGGETIILVIGSEDSPAMQWLADAIFGVSAKTLLSKIKQDVFKGDVPHPLSANDDAGTVKRVQSGPGVVGLVSDAAAKSLPADVAVIAVE